MTTQESTTSITTNTNSSLIHPNNLPIVSSPITNTNPTSLITSTPQIEQISIINKSPTIPISFSQINKIQHKKNMIKKLKLNLNTNNNKKPTKHIKQTKNTKKRIKKNQEQNKPSHSSSPLQTQNNIITTNSNTNIQNDKPIIPTVPTQPSVSSFYISPEEIKKMEIRYNKKYPNKVSNMNGEFFPFHTNPKPPYMFPTYLQEMMHNGTKYGEYGNAHYVKNADERKMNKDKEKMRTPPMLAHQFNPSAPHNMTSEFVSALKNYKNNVVNRMEIVNNKEFGKFLHQFIGNW
eukprot:230923_1